MREARKTTIIVFAVGASFMAGFWLHRSASRSAAVTARRILYYHDPMHPAYRSDKPGVAPDCGMQLEPVYSGGGSEMDATNRRSVPGTVRIDTEQQQIIGLRTVPVMKSAGHHVIRALGRVAADETRVYRVAAGSEGLIQTTSPAAVGDIVRSDDILATAYTREVLTAQQGYINSLIALEGGFGETGIAPGMHRMKTMPVPADANKNDPKAQQLAYLRTQLRVAEDQLRSFGVSDSQMTTLSKSRTANGIVEFRAPANGVVLFRNVNAGQRLERGTELFRIADITHLWVLTDLFESDAGAVHPGILARIQYQGRTFQAKVSRALPQLDPASRTMRTRLEVENMPVLLTPGVFVEVEFDIREAEGIAVPAVAILDTGQRRVVFVSPSAGVFEPRQVMTAARYGDRVQITKGLVIGEQIVVSGMFLLDSESRLKLAATSAQARPAHQSQASGPSTTDPVCGMRIAISAAHSHVIYEGETYYFCSESCRRSFENAPASYANKTKAAAPGGRP